MWQISYFRVPDFCGWAFNLCTEKKKKLLEVQNTILVSTHNPSISWMFNMLILICYGVDINNVVVIKQCKSSVMRRRLVKKKSVICEFHMMKLHSNSVCVEIVYLPHPLLKCSSCLLYIFIHAFLCTCPFCP